MTNTLLSLEHFGVAYGERVVLSDVHLDIPEYGIVTLFGPAGTGKSTLLRTLAGFNNTNPSLRTWGSATYAGHPLGEHDMPALVSQSAKLMMSSVLENVVGGLPERSNLTLLQQRELAVRLMTDAGIGPLTAQIDEPVVRLSIAEQRHIAILRLAAANPRLLCIDEPTTGLGDDECKSLLDYIQHEAKRRAVLVVLHNQAQARELGGRVALMAGGVIQESGEADSFFENPQSAAGREFLRMGTCCVPSPDADPSTLDQTAETPAPAPTQARVIKNNSFGPRGFLWLKRGVLAGTPRPGIFFDVDYDLEALKRVGITTLVALTVTPPDMAAIEAHGLHCLHSPVPDMDAPSPEQAVALCQQLDEWIAAGESIAVHCRAGLGRTGTLLASYLIWEGTSALAALDTVRRVEPRWVQSEQQVAFLETFASVIANSGPARRAGLARRAV